MLTRHPVLVGRAFVLAKVLEYVILGSCLTLGCVGVQLSPVATL